MKDREIKSAIESLLFMWGEPLNVKDISMSLEIPIKKVKALLDELSEEMVYYQRGVRIKKFDQSYQLCTPAENHKYISRLVSEQKTPRSLTTSAMETLAIIAYKQPVTRIEIEAIRGVKSASPIDTLLGKNLIQETGRLEQIGRPILYGTTLQFLQQFNLKSLEELPPIEEIGIEEQQLEIKDEDNETE